MKKRVTFKSKTVCLPDANNLPKPCYADVLHRPSPGPGPGPEPELKSITINCSVVDAYITINGVERSEALLPQGSSYAYTVSKPGYNTFTGMGVLEENASFNIFTVEGSSDVTMTFESTELEHMFVAPGTTVSYTATKEGFLPTIGSKTIIADTVIPVNKFTLAISPTPDLVEVNGQTITNILFPEGSSFTYTVHAEKFGYADLDISGTTNTTLNLTETMPDLGPLCFTAEEAGSTIGYTNPSNLNVNIKYSSDKISWTNLAADTPITLTNVGDKIYFKGNNPNGIGWDDRRHYFFYMTGKIAGSGNLNSLIDDGDGSTVTTLPSATGCFFRLFGSCTSLTTPPELPATTLSASCYRCLFQSCTSLIKPPKLPATTLGKYCYSQLFDGCSSLQYAPELPATTLVEGCYYSMFMQCSLVNSIKIYYTGDFSSEYFNSWVGYVGAQGEFYYNGTDTKRGSSGIPNDWTIIPF